MARLLVRRLLLSAVLVIVVPSLTFFFEALAPGNIPELILGPSATPRQIRILTKELGLNKPLASQYWHWLSGLLTGHLGIGYLSGEQVSTIIAQRLPVSFSIMIGSVVIAIIVGVPLGVVSATRGRVTARVVDIGSVVGIAVPGFLIAIALILLFAVKIRLFPAIGYVGPTASITGWARSMILPWISLGLGMATYIARQTRDQMLSILNRDFIRTLQANGVPRWSVVFRHALRNSGISVVTLIGLAFVAALTGSVFIEQAFDLPGLGSQLVLAASNHDLPLVEGISLVFTVMVVAISLVVDFLYAALDPRVRSTR